MSEVTAADAGPDAEDPLSPGFRDAIANVLDAFIDTKQAELAGLGDDLSPLFVTARSSVRGGKRLRPAFAYWGWRAAGAPQKQRGGILTAAAAIELVHASALVHDDVMDDSATRRGLPAAHRQFARLRRPVDTAGPAQRSRQFGGMAAILLGDLLLAWSDELLGQSAVKPQALVRGRVYFDKLRTEVIAGQYLDVLAQTSSTTSAAAAMRVVRYKSAKYTIERPLQFGAALAKAPPPLLSALSSYGIPLGEAFQLRDDILGVFGDTDVTGKPSGDDIREGKRTLLMARAFDKATAAQRKVLEANLGRADVDSTGMASVQEVLRGTGALAAVETVIAELTSAALTSLQRAPIEDTRTIRALQTLADRATRRSV